ncbi:MAG: ribosome maturation factor RimP [Candidatus Omnitrophica bacterium]|nr:ribosome maturation factor RimP [Candidatus Omnitrophota bacterium]
MYKTKLIDELRVIIGDYLASEGKELVDLTYRHEGRNIFLRILVDNPEGGIKLDECTYLSEAMGNILDERGILEQQFILEVSSPGLDRPLVSESDFLRCLNKKAKFFLRELVNGKVEWDGIISKVEGDSVYVDINGNLSQIPLSKINKAKQII